MLRMVNVGLGTAPLYAQRTRRRPGQYALARAHLARQQNHVAYTQASAKAIAQALHLSFVFAKDIQQISHLYFFISRSSGEAAEKRAYTAGTSPR